MPGAPSSWIFDVEGEAGFRERERQVLDELAQQRRYRCWRPAAARCSCLQNRRLLAARGMVIHLDSPLERLVERTRKDRKRPLLRQGDPRATLERLHRERDPLYREIARYRFVTDRQGPKLLAREIEQRLREDGVV